MAPAQWLYHDLILTRPMLNPRCRSTNSDEPWKSQRSNSRRKPRNPSRASPSKTLRGLSASTLWDLVAGERTTWLRWRQPRGSHRILDVGWIAVRCTVLVTLWRSYSQISWTFVECSHIALKHSFNETPLRISLLWIPTRGSSRDSNSQPFHISTTRHASLVRRRRFWRHLRRENHHRRPSPLLSPGLSPHQPRWLLPARVRPSTPPGARSQPLQLGHALCSGHGAHVRGCFRHLGDLPAGCAHPRGVPRVKRAAPTRTLRHTSVHHSRQGNVLGEEETPGVRAAGRARLLRRLRVAHVCGAWGGPEERCERGGDIPGWCGRDWGALQASGDWGGKGPGEMWDGREWGGCPALRRWCAV